MTRKQMEQRIEELSDELRQLKAKQESGHCHGCHCGHVIWYPWTVTTTSWPGQTIGTGTTYSYQIANTN